MMEKIKVGCYHCHKEAHYNNQCPKLAKEGWIEQAYAIEVVPI